MVQITACYGCAIRSSHVFSSTVSCEFPAELSYDVLFPISGEPRAFYDVGAEISYGCSSGFYPQDIIQTVCLDSGLWSPNPALHNCTSKLKSLNEIEESFPFHPVDCGAPEFTSSGSVSVLTSTKTSTTEGAIMSFQCDDGFFLSSGSCGIIQCTDSDSVGLWFPDPATLVCTSSGMSLNSSHRLYWVKLEPGTHHSMPIFTEQSL